MRSAKRAPTMDEAFLVLLPLDRTPHAVTNARGADRSLARRRGLGLAAVGMRVQARTVMETLGERFASAGFPSPWQWLIAVEDL